MIADWAPYQAIVGKRWERYAPRFERFARGGYLSWNWAAFFGTFAWMRYRRLYGWSWLYFFSLSTPFAFTAWAWGTAMTDRCARAIAPQAYLAIDVVPVVLAIGGLVVAPLVADWLYFRHLRTLVEAGGKPPEAVSRGAIGGAFLLQAIFYIVSVMTVPTYANYLSRSRVTEGINAAGVLREPFEGYLMREGKAPSRIAEITSARTSTRNVREVSLAPGGALRATFGESAERLAGRSILWVPRIEGTKVSRWTCRSDDLPNACLPDSCRK